MDKLTPTIIARYNLGPLIYNKHVYFEIRKCMYGLPQAGKLSQTRLINHLRKHGYYVQCPNTPCLFKHTTRDIMSASSLTTSRFKTQADSDHLIQTLQKHAYKLKVRPMGDVYLGMAIAFDPPSYSRKPQTVFIDKSEKLSPTLITELQAIIGTLLYYARAVSPNKLTLHNGSSMPPIELSAIAQHSATIKSSNTRAISRSTCLLMPHIYAVCYLYESCLALTPHPHPHPSLTPHP